MATQAPKARKGWPLSSLGNSFAPVFIFFSVTPAKRKSESATLQGWQQIARHLGQPVATAQRWAKSGMPVTRRGRYRIASPDELNRWVASETGATQAVHIATDNADLAAELKRGLSEARRQRRIHRVK